MGRPGVVLKVVHRGGVVWRRSLCTCSGINRWKEPLDASLKRDMEAFWKDKVNGDKFRQDDRGRDKFYVLSMFPYPSGKLHMGHVRVYTISDTMARFHRITGKNVLHPMGWDAFGLPAENAAVAHDAEPQDWTLRNVAQMRSQLDKLGCNFDWDREVATCDPSYFRWTQYIFLRMFRKGLVYRKESLVNWDPVDKTVLADEQVDELGRSWRSGAAVEKKLLSQWFVRTTRLAKSLLDGLSAPEMRSWRDVVNLQRHWIGDCCGTSLDFQLVPGGGSLSLWTAAPESAPGASFVAVKPGSVADRLHGEGAGCGEGSWRRLPLEARNPFTGGLLPVFVAAEDLLDYAEGADGHLGAPSLSDRDAAFAALAGVAPREAPRPPLDREAALRLAREGGFGGFPVSSKLRDWLVSRQRYWGTPIPVVHCGRCGAVPLPCEALPVVLPPLKDPEGRERWARASCPECGGAARRETDTMDTFVDSSWYFLRFLDPRNEDLPFCPDKVGRFLPVDLYVGGKEHAVLHLYYARFFNHFLHSEGLVPTPEPFRKLLVQGMIMGKTYRVKDTGRYLRESEVEVSGDGCVEKATGSPVVSAWEKMSKSKHNGVDPDSMLEEYGVDTTRLLVLADVAPTSNRNWSEATFPGVLNWQRRLWKVMQKFLEARSGTPDAVGPVPAHEDAKLLDRRNFHLKAITFNYFETYQLSVAITNMQGLTKTLSQASTEAFAGSLQFERALATLLVTLAPAAPHFASELWAGFLSAPNRVDAASGEIAWDRPVLAQRWPEVDQDYHLDLLCKVNGTDMCTVKLPRHRLDLLTHDDALELALSQTELLRTTEGRKIVNTRFVLYPSYRATINVSTVKSASREAVRKV